MLQKIRPMVETNLEFYHKVPADEQNHSISDKMQSKESAKQVKRSIADVNNRHFNNFNEQLMKDSLASGTP